MRNQKQKEQYCSLCGTSDRERFLIYGPPGANICESCAEICWDIIVRRRFDEANRPLVEPETLIPPNGPPPEAPIDPVPTIPFYEKTGFIYFVHAKLSNRVKIGWSANPDKRIADLLTASPEPLECLGKMPGRITDERALHQGFGADRVHREWFTASPQLLAYISKVAHK